MSFPTTLSMDTWVIWTMLRLASERSGPGSGLQQGVGRVRLETAGADVGPATTVARWRAIVGDAGWSLFVGLVVLNILDLITTALVLDRGGEERNPFVQPLVENMWHVGLLKAAVLVLVATLLTRCQGSRIAELSLAGTTGWYLAVVCWNVAVLTIL